MNMVTELGLEDVKNIEKSDDYPFGSAVDYLALIP